MIQKRDNSSQLPVNPSILRWAREESGYPYEQVAKKISVKSNRIVAWEKGELVPTFRQTQELAKVYHRPFALFFQAEPPKLAPLAAEYRRLPDVVPGQESPELRLAVRQMSLRREHAINLFSELSGDVPAFKLKAHLNEAPETIAERLRKALKIDSATQSSWRDEWQAWHMWRSAVENLGILVFQFLKVNLNEVRGLALLHFPLPVVGINSKERVAGSKSYTLMHEVVHLMLALGQEEKPALKESRTDKQWEDVERFAEVVASHVLVPEADLISAVGPKGKNSKWEIEEVRRLARQFRISPLAMATRLRASGYMSWSGYQDWKNRWNAHLLKLKPSSGGFATQAEKALNRNGKPFAQLVIEALDSNRLASVDAARYLDLKFQHFNELRETVRMKILRGGADE